MYAKQEDAEALRKLLTELRPLFGAITKAKTAKIVRNVVETIAKVPNSTQLQVGSSKQLASALGSFVSMQSTFGTVLRDLLTKGMAMQMEVCKEQVDWAKAEKRTFLRQRIEARLANLYLSNKDYSSALSLISRLLTEASSRRMAHHQKCSRVPMCTARCANMMRFISCISPVTFTTTLAAMHIALGGEAPMVSPDSTPKSGGRDA